MTPQCDKNPEDSELMTSVEMHHVDAQINFNNLDAHANKMHFKLLRCVIIMWYYDL